MKVHIPCKQGSYKCRDSDRQKRGNNKECILSFEEELRDHKITDEIIINCDKDEITKFDGHGFAERNRVAAE
jgi:hypothetical protein